MSQAHTETLEKAELIRHELYDMANSFAGDEYGTVAVMLHRACNHILYAEREYEEIEEQQKEQHNWIVK